MALALLDLDGTLVERPPAFRKWAEQFASACGQGGDFVDWLVTADAHGATDPEVFLSAVRAKMPDADTPSSVAAFWADVIRHFEARAEVKRALSQLREAGWSIAVVANGNPLADKVAASGLLPLVDAVCVSDIEGFAKPDPTLLRIAADRVGQPLMGAWLIGDSASDIEAAARAGIRSVWVNATGRSWPHGDFAPDAEVPCLEDALDVVLANPPVDGDS